MTFFKDNTHSLWIKSSFEKTLPEIVRWGEASWWPKRSLMKFIRQDLGAVREGSRYRQKVLLPCAPSWDVEVTQLTQTSITRKFLNGMFEGSETVTCASDSGGVKVAYAMHYRLKGVLNKMLWVLTFERLHDKNIEDILSSLKKYLEIV